MDTTSHGPAPDSGSDRYAGIVDAAAIRRGHEADVYDNKSVLSVPALVIFFFVLAFGVVSIIFYFLSGSVVEPEANPLAVEQNNRPLNQRLGDIHLDGPVNQPRLEPLRMREGTEKAITSPPTPLGNSPELHPEDIIPSKENTPELFASGPSPDKGFNRIPIDEAMKKAIGEEGKHTLFPTQPKIVMPPKSTNVPSEANAGRGFGPSTVVLPSLPNETPEPAGKKVEQPVKKDEPPVKKDEPPVKKQEVPPKGKEAPPQGKPESPKGKQ